MGYDGKGQAAIRKPEEIDAAWETIGKAPAVLEQFVPFEREISVVAARNAQGDVVAYEPAENLHRDHILHRTRVPAQIPGALAGQAGVIAAKIAAALQLCGRARSGNVRARRERQKAAPGERDRPARAQFRPLDHRRRNREPVRAAHSRGRRLAARQTAPPRPRRNDQPHRRRSERLGEISRRARRLRCISMARAKPAPAAKWGM
jgi:hypothetical protein